MLDADNIDNCLKPGEVINSGHPDIIKYAKKILGNMKLTEREKVVKLYLSVRDDIRYNPYMPFYKPEHYLSSNVIKIKEGFCIPKAGLLCALARACGIPSRIGFASIINHLSTQQLIDYLGSDLIVYHGFTELWLGDKWVKATPAFNAELYRLQNAEPLEFDGINDSIFPASNLDNKQFMEYTDFHGVYHDIPVNLIVSEWEKAYGKERVQKWISLIEDNNGELDLSKVE